MKFKLETKSELAFFALILSLATAGAAVGFASVLLAFAAAS